MPQYTYDKTTGVRVENQESPLEPGTYLQAANSVETAPPSFDASTHEAVWSDENNSWTVLEKYTGPYVSREEEEANKPALLTDEDLSSMSAIDYLRNTRDALLEETDIFATISVDGPTMPASVRTYRQELRDLPSNVSNPQLVLTSDRTNVELTNVTWPNVPQEVLDRR